MDEQPREDDAQHVNTQTPEPKEWREQGLRISETWAYKIFVKSAYKLINKPLAVFRLLKKAIAHIQRYDNVKELAGDARDQIETIIRLVRSYMKGDYRDVSKRNIALSVGALLYFVSPIDLIPDFIAIGLIDDIALMMWVYHNFRGEIELFREWEDNQKTRIEIGTINLDKEE